VIAAAASRHGHAAASGSSRSIGAGPATGTRADAATAAAIPATAAAAHRAARSTGARSCPAAGGGGTTAASARPILLCRKSDGGHGEHASHTDGRDRQASMSWKKWLHMQTLTFQARDSRRKPNAREAPRHQYKYRPIL